jgi:hypothetical protein
MQAFVANDKIFLLLREFAPEFLIYKKINALIFFIEYHASGGHILRVGIRRANQIPKLIEYSMMLNYFS